MNIPTPEAVQRLEQATGRVLDAVAGLDQEQLRAPSLLPDWTRAHVIAHLALNAEGLAGVLTGLSRGEVVSMYTSNQSRNGDIEELAGQDAAAIRERLVSGCRAFRDAVPSVPEAGWAELVPRTVGGPTFQAGAILQMRNREVEIHHVDLEIGYRYADWPAGFVTELLDVVTVDQGPSGPFRIRATDLDRGWDVGGSDGPTVAATGAALGWWLTGRGESGLTGGAVPALGPWPAAARPQK